MLLQACLVLGTLQGGLVSDRWEIAIVMDRDLETVFLRKLLRKLLLAVRIYKLKR